MTGKDTIDKFLEHGLDFPSKTIYLGSVGDGEWDTGVDHRMARHAIQGLYLLDKTKHDEPITVLMNNPGGDVYHGLAVFDAIRSCKSYVIIKTYGYAMSMGSVVLQAGDRRVMSPNSRMMLHYGTAGAHDHSKNVQRWADEFKRLDKWMEDVYLTKILEKKKRFTRQQLQKKMSFDWFLTAQEAVDLGLADEVMG